jgi:hypothetical protein
LLPQRDVWIRPSENLSHSVYVPLLWRCRSDSLTGFVDAVDEYVIVNELQQRLVVARADLQLRKYLWVSQSIP